MKRINPQWVFLIILALWIPVLAFGYEVDGVEFSGPPEPMPVEHGLMFWIWGWGVVAGAILSGIVCMILTIGGVWTSLKFNYHLYVTHGEFAFWTVDSGSKKHDNRVDVAKNLKMITEKMAEDSKDVELTFVAWWVIWIVITIIWVVAALGSLLWPVVFFAGFPYFLIRTLAFRKRKKQVFVDKLKDKETNGVV